ncbi:D-2-hydroxyacid dehydrogenase [Lacticaseibacillus mingshuiensis]|uniref:D-2-hydroxyacid dehydrogenase n=1 Tax=Lacticaseibacillus mingshuiensis TaxID=2799574 RepID=A0ABW4CEB0_9LACO|nr:D-2-hydroxyacid dehydrogenase [Lacticaseibacillus mingshuiensis]
MKIIAYGARVDEIPYMKQWAQETGNELTIKEELLEADTVEWAKGYDGINCLQTTPYSAAVFDKMGDYGIHYLTLRNVGTDNVDFAAAAKNGVTLANTPAYSPEAIAEFAVTMTLNLLRRVGEVEHALRHGDYAGSTQLIGRELRSQTVGIIGAGRIGRAAIQMFSGFGAKVITYDPHPSKDDTLACRYADMDELLAASDVVDLHIPGVPANDHIIDARALAQMKPGAVLINTARGNLVDTAAMIAALESGHLAGAGIDTYEHETAALLDMAHTGRFSDPQWDQLQKMPNVLLTPHVAYYTETAVHNMVTFSLTYLTELLTTGTTETIVHPK